MSGFGDAPIKAEGQLVEEFGHIVSERSDSAYAELMKELEAGEKVEGIVFGKYGWGGFGEDEISDPIPQDKIGKLMTLDEARPYMQSWSFIGGFGSPDCYATYIWTNKRILWVTQYDGSTCLDSAPRNPVDCIPDMPGG